MEDGFSPIFQHRDAAIAAVVDRAFLAAVVDLAFLAAVVDLVCPAVGYACPSAADDRWPHHCRLQAPSPPPLRKTYRHSSGHTID